VGGSVELERVVIGLDSRPKVKPNDLVESESAIGDEPRVVAGVGAQSGQRLISVSSMQ
jgi:hypothetical protein